jgi:hypothetical protein
MPTAEPNEPRALRRGKALFAGLLRCGHCGRKLHVAYSGKDGNTGRYHCQGGFINHGGDRCISFGGMRIDRDVAAEVIERLQPLGIEAALAAQATRSRASEDKRRQVELEQAAARSAARRQYVPPILTTASLPPSWRRDGTSGWRWSAIWRLSWGTATSPGDFPRRSRAATVSAPIAKGMDSLVKRIVRTLMTRSSSASRTTQLDR